MSGVLDALLLIGAVLLACWAFSSGFRCARDGNFAGVVWAVFVLYAIVLPSWEIAL